MKQIMRILTVMTLALSVVLSGVQAGEAAKEVKADAAKTEPTVLSAHEKAMIIPIDGVILPNNPTLRFFLGDQRMVIDDEVVAAIDKAEKDGATRIILEIDSPGGVVDACEKICQRLLATPLPTTALVTKRAISGGSMVATACKEIVMVTGTTIGDCEPHAINAKLPDYMREKVESPIRARMRANAEANGYPGKLLEAMVTKSIELYWVAYADKTTEFLEKAQLELIEKQIEKKEIKKRIEKKTLVVKEGRLLTLTAMEAEEYGLAKEVLSSVGAFYKTEDIQESEKYLVEKKIEKKESIPNLICSQPCAQSYPIFSSTRTTCRKCSSCWLATTYRHFSKPQRSWRYSAALRSRVA
jgi:membrane-bound ClpP family serine protease